MADSEVFEKGSDITKKSVSGDETKREMRAGFFLSLVQGSIYFLEIIKSFVVPSVLGPTMYGVWKAFGLFQKYSNMLHLGTFHAMNREIPIAIGRGDVDRQHQIRNASYSLALILSVVVLVLPVFGYLLGFDFGGSLNSLWLAGLIGLWSSLTLYGVLQDRFALARAKYKILGKVRLAQGIVAAVLAVIMVLVMGVPGLLIAGVVALGLNNFLFFRLDKKPKFTWSFNSERVWELLRIGFPIFLNNTAATLYWSIDSLIIVLFLGPMALGVYSFSLITFPLLQMVPDQVASVVSQRMARQIGELGRENPRHMSVFLEENQVLVQWLATSAALGAGLIFSPLVRIAFPQYIEAIPVAHVLMFGYLFYRLRGFTGYILILLNKQFPYLLIQLLALGGNALGDFLVLRAGYGLEVVAWVCTCGYIFFGFLLTLYGYRLIYGRTTEAWVFLARVSLANIMVMGLFKMSGDWFSGWSGVLWAFLFALLAIAFLAAYFWLTFSGFRRSMALVFAGGWRGFLRKK